MCPACVHGSGLLRWTSQTRRRSSNASTSGWYFCTSNIPRPQQESLRLRKNFIFFRGFYGTSRYLADYPGLWVASTNTAPNTRNKPAQWTLRSFSPRPCHPLHQGLSSRLSYSFEEATARPPTMTAQLLPRGVIATIETFPGFRVFMKNLDPVAILMRTRQLRS